MKMKQQPGNVKTRDYAPGDSMEEQMRITSSYRLPVSNEPSNAVKAATAAWTNHIYKAMRHDLLKAEATPIGKPSLKARVLMWLLSRGWLSKADMYMAIGGNPLTVNSQLHLSLLGNLQGVPPSNADSWTEEQVVDALVEEVPLETIPRPL